MDNEKELVRFILQYLLDNHFESKSDMARQLDIRHRTMQRVFEQLHNDKAKGSTIVLDRALLFCAKRKISVDQLFKEYQDFHQGVVLEPVQHKDGVNTIPVARTLCMPEIEILSEAVKECYEKYSTYVRVLATFMCTRCSRYPNCCNPWGGLDWMHGDCTMAKLSQNLLDTVSKSKMEAE